MTVLGFQVDSNDLGWLILVVLPLVVGAFYAIRLNSGRIYKEVYEAKEEQLKVVAGQRDEAVARAHTAEKELAAANARTDLTPLLGRLDEHRVLLEEIATLLKEMTTNGLPRGVS